MRTTARGRRLLPTRLGMCLTWPFCFPDVFPQPPHPTPRPFAAWKLVCRDPCCGLRAEPLPGVPGRPPDPRPHQQPAGQGGPKGAPPSGGGQALCSLQLSWGAGSQPLPPLPSFSRLTGAVKRLSLPWRPPPEKGGGRFIVTGDQAREGPSSTPHPPRGFAPGEFLGRGGGGRGRGCWRAAATTSRR